MKKIVLNFFMKKFQIKNKLFSFSRKKGEELFAFNPVKEKSQKSKKYILQKYQRSNQDTLIFQRPLVREGDWIQSGDLVADCSTSLGGELCLGKNIFIAYMPWEGYNYEDAILISQRLVSEDVYTSIHIEAYEVETRNTKFGKEQFTKQIPDISETETQYLDERGIVKLGTSVQEGDILVGKVTPIQKKFQSPYEKLLYTILEKELVPMRDSSLRTPKGLKAKVLEIKILSFSNEKPKKTVFSSLSKTTSFFTAERTSPPQPRGGGPILSTHQNFNLNLFFEGEDKKQQMKKNIFEKPFFIPTQPEKIVPFNTSVFNFYWNSCSNGKKEVGKDGKTNVSAKGVDQIFVSFNFLPIQKTFFASISVQNTKKLAQFLQKKNQILNQENLGCFSPLCGSSLWCRSGPNSSFFSFFRKNLKPFDTSSISTGERTKSTFHNVPCNIWSRGSKTPFPSTDKLGLAFQKYSNQHNFSKTLFFFLSRRITIPIPYGVGVESGAEQKKTKKKIHLIDKKVQNSDLFHNKIGPLRGKIPEKIQVYLVEKRKIQVGDKMSGRHGNKGIVSQILPIPDMPFLPDGTPLDMVLNPLGVPSRMNVGQIYECILGLASKYLQQYYRIQPFDEIYGPQASRSFTFSKLYEARKKTSQKWLFNPCYPGKIHIFDGRTGEPYENPVTVGISYILKLVHLVDDKIHARSTGPYSLVTQQPLRGRSKYGGQRVGEMEVWAIEAYGAAFILLEMLTIKSDDISGRMTLWSNILLNMPIYIGTPESFKVLVCELQALCLDMGLYRLNKKGFLTQIEHLMQLP